MYSTGKGEKVHLCGPTNKSWRQSIY